MTPDDFINIGRLLHGNDWISAIAADLNINRRTVMKMRDGVQSIPPGIAADMAELCEARAKKLTARAKELRAAGPALITGM